MLEFVPSYFLLKFFGIVSSADSFAKWFAMCSAIFCGSVIFSSSVVIVHTGSDAFFTQMLLILLHTSFGLVFSLIPDTYSCHDFCFSSSIIFLALYLVVRIFY